MANREKQFVIDNFLEEDLELHLTLIEDKEKKYLTNDQKIKLLEEKLNRAKSKLNKM